MRTTSIRFTGLASGLDTEALVQNMVLPYKMKMDSARQQQTMMEWKKDAWRDMNKQMFNFYDKQLAKLRLESTYNKRNISVSNSNAIEVKPNGTLPEGTHTIDSITKLAESAKVNTNKLHTSNGEKVTSATKLSDLIGRERNAILGEGETITIQVSDAKDSQGNPIYKEVEISGDITVGELQNKLKTALPNTSISFDESAGAFFITGKKTGSSQFLSITAVDEEISKKAFDLLGIKFTTGEGNLEQTKETVIGQITFDAMVKAPHTTKLSELQQGLADADKLVDGDILKLSIDGKEVSVELKVDMSIADLEKAVNAEINKEGSALKGEATFKYNAEKGQFEVFDKDNKSIENFGVEVPKADGTSKLIFAEAMPSGKGLEVLQTQRATGDTKVYQLGIKDGDFTVKVGNKVFPQSYKITSDTTLKELTEAIQAEIEQDPDLKGNTVFKFDEKTGRLEMSGNIEVTEAVGTQALEKLGIGKNQEVFTAQGKNAKLSYNGVEVESESNNISVNGFNFTIKATTAPTGEAITVISTFDTDAVIDEVKGFVEEYNKLIDDIYGKLDATSAKGYLPLTDEQKKEMSDYEIEQWEKKIKDSLFRNDPDLRKAIDDMRKVMGGIIEGSGLGSLASIGITTGDWKENGKLHFDEDKFRKALSEDMDGVVQLMAGSGDPEHLYLEKNPGATSKDYASLSNEAKAEWENRTKGFMDRMYDHITASTKFSELKSAYSFYNDKLQDKKIQTQIKEAKKLEERMIRMEDMYYKRFTAMEKMMQQLNNQSNWLTSQMGGM